MIRIAKMFIGAILLVIGLVALLTPFTPGAWLIFVGLELLGIRLIIWGKDGHIRNPFQKQDVSKKK